MSLKIKVTKLKNQSVRNKYYGKVVARDEVHTKDIARRICADTTLTEADVYAAIQALVTEMKHQLQSLPPYRTERHRRQSQRLQPLQAHPSGPLQIHSSRHTQPVHPSTGTSIHRWSGI